MATTRAEAKKKNDEIYNLQAEQVNKAADAGIKEINTAYDDQQRAVAVQKLINERKVAESMANLGLTDSGLNRTQQTAVQLSAANAGYNLNRQRQADIDAYNLDRDSKLSTIEQNRIAGAAEIDQTYDSIDATAKAAQAQAVADAQEKSVGLITVTNGMLSRDYKGTLSENGVSVKYDKFNDKTTYTDRNTGKTSTFSYHTNPYTNTVNQDTEYGCFGNGYQPNNIQGVALSKKDTIQNELHGIEQNVYFCSGRDKNGKVIRDENGKSIAGYYTWWATLNCYVKVESTTEITPEGRKTYWDVVDPRVTNLG